MKFDLTDDRSVQTFLHESEGEMQEISDPDIAPVQASVDDRSRPSAPKTTDLGITGLTPAVHLGAGGSANVFAAKQLDTGEQVAVKLLRASADSEKERIRFQREQETLSRLSAHDGIVPVLDAGLTDREEPYFLMPLMEGSLQDRIDRDGALDWQTATQLMVEVAETVSFAHDHQVLHRDLKPGNILLDSTGIPRVSDFGIAKLLDSSVSKSSKSLGTPSFMPPERFNGEEATEASDVYGLAATLVSLITGQAPFLTGENDTDVAVMMRVVTDEPPSLEGHDVPDHIRDAVRAAMAKDPSDRPSTVEAFAAQLRLGLEGHLDPALAGPVTVAIPRRNLTIPDVPITTGASDGLGFATLDLDGSPVEEEEERRKPVWLLAAAAALVLAVIGGGLLFALGGDDQGSDVASGAESDTEIDETLSEAGDQLGTDDADLAASNEADGEASFVEGEDLVNDANNSTAVDGQDGEAQQGAVGDHGTDVGDGDASGDGGSSGNADPGEDGTAPEAGGGDGGVVNPEPAAAPVACFSVSSTAVEVGETVRFQNCSTDATSYSWDLAGTSSSAASASTSWSTPGTKTVTLTARGEGGTETETARIVVSEEPPPPPEPTACFNPSASSIQTGDQVRFANCSSDATSYSWDFGDGTSSTLASPSKTYTAAGSRTVRLTVTGPGGTASDTATIRVVDPAPAPVACFSASTTAVEVDDRVTFTNCSTNAGSYSWDFGDGTSSTLASPSKSWSSAGTRTVRLTVTGDGGTDSETVRITVSATPPPPPEPHACFNASALTVDVGQRVSFTNCSSDATSYSWDFGDGTSSTLASPSKTYSSEGRRTVELTATGAGGMDSTTRTITVETTAPPPPEACFNANRLTVDLGDSITFTNCSTNADMFTWDFGDGGTSGNRSATHTYTVHGTFTVRLVAEGDGGEDTATRTVTINAVDNGRTDEEIRPKLISCTTIGESEWTWTWETLPAWVDDYLVRFSDGSTQSVGDQPRPFTTTRVVDQIIAVEGSRQVSANTPPCPDFDEDVVTPTGISCQFSNFRWENDVWTWAETWTWRTDPSVDSYRIQLDDNGSFREVGAGFGSFFQDGSNGQPSSGISAKQIIAVGSNGDRAIAGLSPCGNNGGSGWVPPTPR